jgi:anti-sigma factor RsiW
VLERYVAEHLPAEVLPSAELASGRWVERLPALLARPRPAAIPTTGATVAAEKIAGWCGRRELQGRASDQAAVVELSKPSRKSPPRSCTILPSDGTPSALRANIR